MSEESREESRARERLEEMTREVDDGDIYLVTEAWEEESIFSSGEEEETTSIAHNEMAVLETALASRRAMEEALGITIDEDVEEKLSAANIGTNEKSTCVTDEEAKNREASFGMIKEKPAIVSNGHAPSSSVRFRITDRITRWVHTTDRVISIYVTASFMD